MRYKSDRVVWIYGRLNPPTIGHIAMLKELAKTAKEYDAEFVVYLSKTQDNKKNPLTQKEKIDALKELRLKDITICDDQNITNILAAYRDLWEQGVKHQWVIGGADRADDYKKFAERNSTRFDTSGFLPGKRVVVNGEEISATVVRNAALDGDYDKFSKLIAPVSEKTKKDIYHKIQERLKKKGK